MRNLFRSCGIAYHSGKRARNVIDALDMELLIRTGLVPLSQIEELIFK
ncbi:MAG: hypothetical protein Q4C01_02660 [Clostridia bacterium]|nr:hypothetical protein [Clostridia bacterium]